MLEGRFRIAVCPDRVGDDPHPYVLGLVQPTDGLGFIRESLISQAGFYQKMRRADGLEPYGGRKPNARLAPQAMQHLPADDGAAEKLNAQARQEAQRLAAAETVRVEDVYQLITTAGVKGASRIAWPMANAPAGGQIMLPQLLRNDRGDGGGNGHDDDGHVLVGRAPYDSIRSLQQAKMVSARSERVKVTQQLLETSVSLQYGSVQSRMTAAGGKELIFAKGVLVVVRDEDWKWPVDIVMSANDIKSASSWTESKRRATTDEQFDGIGVLMVTEAWAPGSAVAVDANLQATLGGDFDGDAAFVLSGMPELTELAGRQNAMQRQTDERLASKSEGRDFKAPKTFHAAITAESGFYSASRTLEIQAAKKPLLGKASTLQFRVGSLRAQEKLAFAEEVVLQVYEGLPADVVGLLRGLLLENDDAQTGPAAQTWSAQKVDQLVELGKQLDTYKQNMSERLLSSIGGEVDSLRALLRRWARHAQVAWGEAERGDADKEELEEVEDSLDKMLKRLPMQILDARPQSSLSYVPGEPLVTMERLLTEIIKRGTDAFKAPYGLEAYEHALQKMETTINKLYPQARPPYMKWFAGRIAKGEVDVPEVQQQLQNNPTMAARIMGIGLDAASRSGVLEKVRRQALERQAQKQTQGQPGSRDKTRGAEHALQRRPRAGLPGTVAPAPAPPGPARHAPAPSGSTDNPDVLLQHAEALLQHVQKHAARITEGMQAITQQLDGSMLVDLEQHTKTREELLNKWTTRRKSLASLREADTKDALRYTLILDADRFTEQTRTVLAQAAQRGWDVKTVSNFFARPGAAYKAVHLTLNDRQAPVLFEVQLHTQQSHTAKNQTHSDYQRAKAAGGEDKAALEARMRKLASSVPTPAGAGKIDMQWAQRITEQRPTSSLAATETDAGPSHAARAVPAQAAPPTGVLPAVQPAQASAVGQLPGRPTTRQSVLDMIRKRPRAMDFFSPRTSPRPSGTAGQEAEEIQPPRDVKRPRLESGDPSGSVPEMAAWVESLFRHEPAIMSDMQTIASLAQGQLKDLGARFKWKDVPERTMQQRVADALSAIGNGRKDNVLRYVMVWKDEHVLRGVETMLAAMARRGWTVESVTNGFRYAEAEFKNICITAGYPEAGLRFAIHVYTEGSYEAKQDNKSVYQARKKAEEGRQSALSEEIKRRNERISKPAGIGAVGMNWAQSKMNQALNAEHAVRQAAASGRAAASLS